MKPPSDEILMAYADGELRGAEHRAVRSCLRNDKSARTTVRMFRWTASIVDEATGDVNFEIIPERINKLFRSCSSKPARRQGGWPLCRIQTAAGAIIVGVFVIWADVIVDRSGFGAMPPDTNFALGKVSGTSLLATALERRSRFERVDVGGYRFVGVARFEDKFGDLCQELEVLTAKAAAPPTAVVVACQRGPADWDIVGALHTQPSRLRAEADTYVTDAAKAHEAVGGILNMIGAKQRTTALDVDRQTR